MSLSRALPPGPRQRLLALLHGDAQALELIAPQALGVHEDAGLLLQHVAQHDPLDQAHAEGEIGALHVERPEGGDGVAQDRKSTRLNSSHLVNSYAVFCLKKKKNQPRTRELKSKRVNSNHLIIYSAVI